MVSRNLRVLSLTALALALIPATASASMSRPSLHALAEDARLRAHFAEVLADLSDAAPRGLSARQSAARAQHLRALRDYARAGRFPRHHGEAPGRTPIFVDRDGNRCAMAYLIERSGRGDLVARIAHASNLACILDLAGDPELVAWLDQAGLSLEEAARIQPAYQPYQDDDSDDPDGSVMVTSAFLAVGLCGPAIILNMNGGDTHRERITRIALGTLAGGAVAAAGIADWSSDSHLRGSGYLALTMGVASIVMSQVNLWLGDRPESPGAAEPRMGAMQAPARPVEWSAGLRLSPEGTPQMAVRLGF